jgi:hypothetical protein
MRCLAPALLAPVSIRDDYPERSEYWTAVRFAAQAIRSHALFGLRLRGYHQPANARHEK